MTDSVMRASRLGTYPVATTYPRLKRMMCQVHKALMACKHAKSFLEPVDWVALKIPTYPEIITHPMDLGTIQVTLSYSLSDGISVLMDGECRLS